MDSETVWLLKNDMETTTFPVTVFWDLVRNGAIKGQEKELQQKEDPISEILLKTDSKQLQKANARLEVVQQVLNGVPVDEIDTPDRTIRDWVRKYRDAEKVYGNGFIGLITDTSKQGNRNRKISQARLDLLAEHIENDFETIKQKNIISVYRVYKEDSKEKGLEHVSKKTFSNEIKKRPIHEQTEKRQGEKVAYATEPFFFELDFTTPRHGVRPFDICHIDHTELDVELKSSRTGEVLGRPWLTIMTDAYCRRILAFYLTYDSPSYRSCMMVIRECVRRHNRFPNTIVVDGGKEFQSVYFETLIAFHGAIKKNRPPAEARAGSVCERLFGTTNTLFINNLSGNTQITKNVRQVTKSVNPKNHAVWTLKDLYEKLEEWFHEVYDNKIHSTLCDSPRNVFIKNQKETGQRKMTFVQYDEKFRILTLPSTKKGHAKYQPGNGIKINRFYYTSHSLRNNHKYEGKQVEVKYDPYNLGIAYAYINGRWIKLMSEFYSTLRNKTEKQLNIAAKEVSQEKKMAGIETDVTSKEIADFLNRVESHEDLLIQQQKDLEQRAIFEVIEGGRSSAKKKELNTSYEVKTDAVDDKESLQDGQNKVEQQGRESQEKQKEQNPVKRQPKKQVQESNRRDYSHLTVYEEF